MILSWSNRIQIAFRSTHHLYDARAFLASFQAGNFLRRVTDVHEPGFLPLSGHAIHKSFVRQATTKAKLPDPNETASGFSLMDTMTHCQSEILSCSNIVSITSLSFCFLTTLPLFKLFVAVKLQHKVTFVIKKVLFVQAFDCARLSIIAADGVVKAITIF